MREILTRLYDHQKLNRNEAKDILKRIASREFNEAEMTSFMTVYLMRPISVEELQGFKDALLDMCVRVDLSEFDTIDMCGTGGDGKNTFNISTLASFVVAGAGYKVAKHGNYGVSSTCGSSNVLESLGYHFTNEEKVLQDQLRDANITFLHAPKFHPAMATVAPIRRQLRMKTFFNMLGPIVNPSNPQQQLAGVFSAELSRLYQYLFQKENKNYAIIYGLDGYDEISLTGEFIMRDRFGEHRLTPDDLKLGKVQEKSLYGGETVEEAVGIFRKILNGKGTNSQNTVVLANAAMAIEVMKGRNDGFSESYKEAKESLMGGKALNALRLLT